MKRKGLIVLALCIAMGLVATSALAYQFKMGMMLRTQVFWSITQGAAGPGASTRAPDTTTFLVGIPQTSYLQAEFVSDDKSTGGRVRIGLGDRAPLAGDQLVILRNLYGWYKFGRCKLVIGHTDNMFASSIGGPYAQLGWGVGNSGYYVSRIRDSFKNMGKLTSGRFSQVTLYYEVNAWTFMISVGAVPTWPTEGATPTMNGNITANAWLPRLDLAVHFRNKWITIVPGFSIYQSNYEPWQGVADPQDDTYLAWMFALPFHVSLGNFGFKGEVGYGRNWATANYEDYFHDGVYWGGANDRINGVLVRGKLGDTTIITGTLGFYYKIGKATVWLSGGFVRTDNGSSDAPGAWRHGQNMRYGFSFAVPYQVNKHFSIAPEVAYYFWGNDPRFDVGSTTGQATNTVGQVDLGSAWLIGVQFQFLF